MVKIYYISVITEFASFISHLEEIQSLHALVHHQSTFPMSFAHTSHLWITRCSIRTSHLFSHPGSKYLWVTWPFLICFSILPTKYQPTPCIEIPTLYLKYQSSFYFSDWTELIQAVFTLIAHLFPFIRCILLIYKLNV